MVQQRQQIFCYHVVTGLVVALAVTFMACSCPSPPACSIPPETPEDLHCHLNAATFKGLTNDQRVTQLEVPKLLKVQHGVGCVRADKAGQENDFGLSAFGVSIRDSAEIPPGYNSGTVFLNGWRLRYLNGDHHVQGIGSAIFNIEQVQNGEQQELHWEAGGLLSDRDGEDPFELCYLYTLLFWHHEAWDSPQVPPLHIHAVPMDSDADPDQLTFLHTTDVDASNDTARLLHGAVAVDNPGALLPRGFALTYLTGAPAGMLDDQHLLQAGFDLGTPVLDAASISWTSNTLLKDNSKDKDYRGAELVSVLSGASVQMWHPDTVLRSLKGEGFVSVSNTVPLTPNNDPATFPEQCVGEAPPEKQVGVAQFKVENVPFDYAVPVLTGWQLEYPCSDNHVEKIGVWISGFHYDATWKTLFYTIESTLDDDAVLGQHTGEAQYAVSILGLNRAGLLGNKPDSW
jgi:hypothetical protein